MAAGGDMIVLGLGRFGRTVARKLVELGREVLGVDADPRVVQACSDELTQVVQADATDIEALQQLGASDFDTAVVAMGTNIEASILATYALVDLGIERIWAKAVTEAHGAILERVGAHRVVFPERDMGVRVAHSMTGRTGNYLELDPDFVLIETTVPSELAGKRLRDARVRSRWGVTVVCVKRAGGSFTFATPDTELQSGDLIVIAGHPKAAEAFASLP
jgi:trk system potassium uptake protein